ncbi:MAG: hypothetical protein EBU84_09940, partial [Actinobacteria bacterium]|nr:hypothetical protein [Actinomycetota bacterium]
MFQQFTFWEVVMKRLGRGILVATLVVGLLGVVGSNANASIQTSALKIFTLNLTVKSGQNKTFLLVSKSGRTLDSVRILSGARNATKAIQFKTDGDNKVSSIAGATIQIVASSGGDYYGPVVLGWNKNPGN